MDFDPSLALIPPRAASAESSDDADRERRIIPEDDNPSEKMNGELKSLPRYRQDFNFHPYVFFNTN